MTNKLIIDNVEYSWVERKSEPPTSSQQAKFYIPQPVRDEKAVKKLAIEKRIKGVHFYLMDVFGVQLSEFNLLQVYGKVNLVKLGLYGQPTTVIPVIYPYNELPLDQERNVRHNIKKLNEWVEFRNDAKINKDIDFSWKYWSSQIKKSSNMLLSIFSNQLTDDEYQAYFDWMGDILLQC